MRIHSALSYESPQFFGGDNEYDEDFATGPDEDEDEEDDLLFGNDDE